MHAGAHGQGQPVTSVVRRDAQDAAAVELPALDGEALCGCIKRGTAVWRRLLDQPEAARMASSNGDFDLEHMYELGGYSSLLHIASYTPTSLLDKAGDATDDASAHGGRHGHPLSPASAAAAAAAAAMPSPTGSVGSVQNFARFVRGLAPGVYVLGVHGHFSTLWVRPGSPGGGGGGAGGGSSGTLHLIDSLGASLAADCPLAFIVEFDCKEAFIDFFFQRHKAASENARGDKDICAGNIAALIDVHEFVFKGKRPPPPPPSSSSGGGVAALPQLPSVKARH